MLRSIEGKRTLEKVFELVKKLRDNFALNDGLASDNPYFAIPIVDDIYLTILSPSSHELAKYTKNRKHPLNPVLE